MVWEEILQAARAGQRLNYKAPMNVRGVNFYQSNDESAWTYKVVGKRRQEIKFHPSPSEGDPFFADAGHADRITVVINA